jgi:ribose/xylose/arabinose/galactoside ABC-type transport system permease subunit
MTNDLTSAGRTWTWAEILYRIGPFLGLALVILVFGIVTPETFLTRLNFETVMRQTAITGFAALGMTLIVIAGGIDLSVGSVVALSSVMIAWLLRTDASPLIALCGGLAIASLCGLINGIIITQFRIVPFIVTLGTMLIVRGSAKLLAHDQTVNPPAGTWLNDLTSSLGPDDRWRLFPTAVWLMLGLGLLLACVLRYTAFGRHLLAVGSNEQAARLCGIRVQAVKIALYTIGGLFAGVAGLMLFSRLTLGDPTAAIGLELNVIAAVVIGGGSLAGGSGSILGTLVGALLMTVIGVGCTHLNIPNSVQEILTGAIIVLAVGMDRFRHRAV